MDEATVAARWRELASDVRSAIEQPALVAIRRGGERLTDLLAEALGADGAPDRGAVDIALYRDDAATVLPDPKIGPSHLDFGIEGRDVVLVDDVLQTGRTVRAAIDALFDYGRPRRVWLAVLVDRGGRELPIAADFVGRSVTVGPGDRVRVEETDAGLRVVTRPA